MSLDKAKLIELLNLCNWDQSNRFNYLKQIRKAIGWDPKTSSREEFAEKFGLVYGPIFMPELETEKLLKDGLDNLFETETKTDLQKEEAKKRVDEIRVMIHDANTDKITYDVLAEKSLNSGWNFIDPIGHMEASPEEVEDFLVVCSTEIRYKSTLPQKRQNFFNIVVEAWLRWEIERSGTRKLRQRKKPTVITSPNFGT